MKHQIISNNQIFQSWSLRTDDHSTGPIYIIFSGTLPETKKKLQFFEKNRVKKCSHIYS